MVNAFDTNQINRIEFLPPEVEHSIVQTFITNTNDLLVLVRTDTEFILFCIDLDKSNIYELTNEDEVKTIFEPTILYRYLSSSVDNKNCTQLFARGSTFKQTLDIGHKLIVFFLHDNTLYNWTQIHDEHDCGDPIQKVSEIC